MSTVHRDRIYVRKDILIELSEHGEMTQNRLLILCRLNLTKQKYIIDKMLNQNLIELREEAFGHTHIHIYRITAAGQTLLNDVLQKYEDLFPRN